MSTSLGRVAALSAALGLGVMAAAAPGCGPGDTRYYCDNTGCYNCDGYGCHQVNPPTNTVCTGDKQCAQNQICTDQGCETTCKADTDCAAGQVCKSNLCAAATATNPANPLKCSSDKDCAAGQECVGTGIWAECKDKSDVCVYSSECGAGKVCADGECLNDCSSGQSCPSGTVCTKGVCEPNGTQCTSDAQCSGSTPKCVDGSCTAACSDVGTSACAAGEYCDNGACVPDTRPQPNCSSGAECLSTQECLDGFCRYTCQSDTQCKLIDTRIGYCAKDNTCRDAAEATAECLSAADCGSGKLCVSNTCQ